jgi:glycosyltransferase involved in cell wall biosynthesis
MTELLIRSSLRERFRLIVVNGTLNRRNATKGRIGPRNVVALLRVLGATAWSIVVRRPAVLYTVLSQNGPGFVRDAALILLGRLGGCRVVCHLHAGSFDRFVARSGALMRRLVRGVVPRIDRVVVLSDSVEVEFTKLFATTPTVRVHNVVAADEVAHGRSYEALADGRARGREGVAVLFLGLLSQAKGFHDVLKAVPAILAKAPTTRFVFAGEVVDTERNIFSDARGWRIAFEDGRSLRAAVRARYPGNVTFHGVMTGDEKFLVLAGADVLVLPSYSEGFPMTILEAMAVGLPIVTTPVGALGEILRDRVNGLFVPIGEPAAVADRLLRLIDDPEQRRAMGQRNYREVRDRFPVERAAGALGDLFEELTLPPRPRARLSRALGAWPWTL